MARKKTSKKVGKKAPAKRRPSPQVSRAKKGKVTTKKKRKVSKAEKKATRPTRRKPRGAATGREKEIKDFFPGTQTKDLTPKELYDRKMIFCRAYALKGIIREACISADISRRTYLKWRKEDEQFNEACQQAEQMAIDLIEEEARRRAIDGFDRPVIYQGEITEYYKDYSDSLLTMLMKGNKPEKYKERTEHSGAVGRPLTLDEEDKEEVVSSILGMIKNKPDPKD